jgi:hypothetical protein
LATQLFKTLPDGVSSILSLFLFFYLFFFHQMTYNTARNTIVRKFTNYRMNWKKVSDDHEVAEALKKCAMVLFDARTFSKGRILFKRRKNTEINNKRDEILRENPDISRVGAFQKAWKILWADADQEYWEELASREAEDVYE